MLSALLLGICTIRVCVYEAADVCACVRLCVCVPQSLGGRERGGKVGRSALPVATPSDFLTSHCSPSHCSHSEDPDADDMVLLTWSFDRALDSDMPETGMKRTVSLLWRQVREKFIMDSEPGTKAGKCK